MSACVIDASVAIKWYVPEASSEAALRLLNLKREQGISLHVPDLFICEADNILWKKMRTGEMKQSDARQIAEALLFVTKVVHPTQPLLLPALDLANTLGRSVYDSIYLALAASLDCVMVTADQRLVNALSDTGMRRFVRFVEDV